MHARSAITEVTEGPATPASTAPPCAALFLLAAFVTLLSCAVSGGADGSGALDAPSFDTLVNGRVVVSNRDLGGVPALRLVEELRIGSAMGTGPDLFGNVGSLAVDQAGSVYVGDHAAGEIRSFAADGTFIRVVTRRGPGPGDIPPSAYPFHIAWQEPNRLWIDATPVLFFVDSLGNFGKDARRSSAHTAWTPVADTLGGIFGRVLNPISVGPSRLMFDSWVEKLAVSVDGAVSFADRMPLDSVEFRLGRTLNRGGARGNLMHGSPTREEMAWRLIRPGTYG